MVRTNRSSGQLTRCATTTGVSWWYAEPGDSSSWTSCSTLATERNRASVAPVAEKAATVSRSGIDALVRAASRVSTTDCETPGAVSSAPAAAAAAASDDTPGTTSNAWPWARHQLICSPMAL